MHVAYPLTKLKEAYLKGLIDYPRVSGKYFDFKKFEFYPHPPLREFDSFSTPLEFDEYPLNKDTVILYTGEKGLTTPATIRTDFDFINEHFDFKLNLRNEELKKRIEKLKEEIEKKSLTYPSKKFRKMDFIKIKLTPFLRKKKKNKEEVLRYYFSKQKPIRRSFESFSRDYETNDLKDFLKLIEKIKVKQTIATGFPC